MVSGVINGDPSSACIHGDGAGVHSAAGTGAVVAPCCCNLHWSGGRSGHAALPLVVCGELVVARPQQRVLGACIMQLCLVAVG